MDNGLKILLTIAGLAIVVACCISSYDEGYRNGQIDAINNEIIYKLTEQNSGEMRWEKINHVLD